MPSLDLKKDFELALSLVRKKFPVDFEVPGFFEMSEKEYRRDYMKIRSIKDLATPIPSMEYHERENVIFAIIRSGFSPNWDIKHTPFYFAHEIGHAIQSQYNKKFSDDNFKAQLSFDANKKKREIGCCHYAFIEGNADHISIESWIDSGISHLENCAIARSGSLLSSFEEFRASNERFFREAYKERLQRHKNDKKEEADWDEVLVVFGNRNNGFTIQENPYVFGYSFMAKHKDKDLLEMIKNPPNTYKELFLEAEYNRKYSAFNKLIITRQ
jgi:hypothetical protein